MFPILLVADGNSDPSSYTLLEISIFGTKLLFKNHFLSFDEDIPEDNIDEYKPNGS
jgi:hypothetical protein